MGKLSNLIEEAKREHLKAVDLCSECKYNIYFGEIYYDIQGKIICQDCINIYKKREGINIE
ncbi:hypothetical protein N496_20205 (plasmid) [Clostridium botulinum A2B3 87]|uniref:hypothetical protein n=1 Tax=Clostridium botulinum TaxID=1491 RepID=UPI0004A55A8F|nr:hypothetical protein [Clostridium botulinum]KRU29336.1 hypothetical protein WG71_15790 [Clostridium sporogenes]KEI94451.1 hypothetical protein N496_20205 [Clostridium botulinum A2B3 87]KRU33424.1 hypothetical protein VT91_09500 [Clostridium sporogenes]KRU33944.1 hypothetical protein VT28_05000 [Clostridium sporogenes]KRU43408.1 hypothetical protein VT95_16730 [Clostridium sporogenes]